jgi:hypothetical protein
VKPSGLSRRAFAASALAAMLVSCDRAQTFGTLAPSVAHVRSWMARDAVRRPLIYAGGDEASYVFTFPEGKLVGSIAETSFGTCSNPNGDVFFTQVGSIVEYAHGGTTPIATFSVPGSAYSCSIDPATGKIAAVVFCTTKCSGDEVVLLAPLEPPKIYKDRALRSLLFCAYDASGNLFVDGYNGSQFGLSELPKLGRRFASVTLNKTIPFGAQIQWDGQHLAIETIEQPAIYRVSVSGSNGRIVREVHLTGVGGRATQSWIEHGKIAVPTGPGNKRAIEILFWNYPAGGMPIRTFKGFIGGGHQMIDGVTFSVPPR